jgi:hypothetical protein
VDASFTKYTQTRALGLAGVGGALNLLGWPMTEAAAGRPAVDLWLLMFMTVLMAGIGYMIGLLVAASAYQQPRLNAGWAIQAWLISVIVAATVGLVFSQISKSFPQFEVPFLTTLAAGRFLLIPWFVQWKLGRGN